MPRYRDILLVNPIRLRNGKGRPAVLDAAVCEGGKIIAVFETENRARAYAHRRNKLSEVKV